MNQSVPDAARTDGHALIHLADAAFFSGDRDACIALIEQAYVAFTSALIEPAELV